MSPLIQKIFLIGLVEIIVFLSVLLSFGNILFCLPYAMVKIKNTYGPIIKVHERPLIHRPSGSRISEKSPKYVVDGKSVIWQYTIMPKPCSEFHHPEIQLVIAVISKPTGYRVRQAIRETWGSLADTACGVRLFFVLGKIVDEVIQNQLVKEAELYHDILQSNQYEDHYRASSLKTLHLYQWCSAFCPKSLYVLRIDDDVWLNLPLYYKFIKRYFDGSRTHAVGKLLIKNSHVVRAPTNKYYVPREEYAADKYPAYLAGAIFVVPTSYLAKILWASKQKEYLPAVFLDDVYVVGILMPAVNLSFAVMPHYVDREDLAKSHRKKFCPHKHKFGIHHSRLKDLYSFWNDPCHKFEKIC